MLYYFFMGTNREMGSSEPIEAQLSAAFGELEVKDEDRQDIEKYLEELNQKDLKTYEHCVRVGLLGRNIGKFLGMKEKPLFYSGLLHDIGKIDIPLEVLNKIGEWTEEDNLTIEGHVIRGFERIKARFPFTAGIILLHHTFQKRAYPKVLPSHLYDYSEETQKLIVEHAKILAFADVYDALHRENSKFGEKKCVTEVEVKERMSEIFPEKTDLINDLYQAGILKQ